MSNGIIVPVAAGLATGIIFIVLFAAWAANPPIYRVASNGADVSVVVIPEGAGIEEKNFEPSIIKVVIGTNNTARWVNEDTVPSSIIADNSSEDPEFAAATPVPASPFRDPDLPKNVLRPGASFEFTFERPGEIHYHSEPHPWMRGTVTVLPAR